MTDDWGLCCEHCFDNTEIEDFIQDNGEEGDCPYCGSRDALVCDTQTVGTFIKDGLRRAYEEADYWAVKEGACRPQSVYDILCHNEHIFSDRLIEGKDLRLRLLETLMDPQLSVREIQHGSTGDAQFQDIFAETLILKGEILGGECTSAGTAWDIFKYTCRHFNRFFDMSDGQTRERMLESLDDVWSQMEKRYRAGKMLYRMRAFDLPLLQEQYELERLDTYREIGPVPYVRVKNNRMSPAGISYTYLASDPKTCAKETRIPDGQTALLGKFALKESLLLLDLTVENVKYQPFYSGSIFSAEYVPDMRWIKDFLLQFAQEISKPISEEDAALEYVPTQLLAEYIRKQGYNGIVFSSSVSPGGKNFVLFYGPSETPPHGMTYLANGEMLAKYTDVLELKTLSYERVTFTPHLSTRVIRSNIPQLEREQESGAVRELLPV